MDKTVTIYLLITPLGIVSSAYAKENDASTQQKEIFNKLGDAYKIEPCALNFSEEFLERVKTMFPPQKSRKKGKK